MFGIFKTIGNHGNLWFFCSWFYLEICKWKDICCWVKVFHFSEWRHYLRPRHTSFLVNQLNWGSWSIMSYTIANLTKIIYFNNLIGKKCWFNDNQLFNNISTTYLLTIISNLFSSSFTPITIVIVCPILTIPDTSDACGPLPTFYWNWIKLGEFDSLENI